MRHCAVMLFVVSLAAAVLYPTPNPTLGAYSALAGNCPGAIPDDEYLDHWAINDCLATGGDVILDDGAYLIGGTLNLTQHGNKQYPPGCSLPGAAYTAYDFGTASLQNGWISRFYHPSGCGS